MKRLSLVLFTALTGLLLIQSCRQADKTNTPVPKDAVFVMHINNTSLSSKLSWQEIKATNWFNETNADETDSLLRKLMDDPDNSGMDTKSDMIVFVKKHGRGGYLVFEGTLKDASAFEAFNKKAGGGAATTKDGDASFIAIKNQGLASWKGTKFVYIMDVPMAAMKNMVSRGGENEQFKFSVDSLKQFAKSTYEISGKNSLGDDDRFAALLKDDGDLHFWVNNEEYLSVMGGDALSLLKAADLVKGNVSASTLSFDNGKIAVKSKVYLNKQMADIFKKYPPKKISADVINRIPSQNVVAVFALNYSPEGLKELIKFSGLDGVTNGFLEKANYSIDEFIKANKGDMVVAISDFEVKKTEVVMPGYDGGEPFKYTTTKPDVKVLFATSVNDKAAFDKLITTLSAQLGDQKNQMPEVNYQLKNDWFVAGNSAEDVNKFLAGGSNKHSFTSKLTDQSFGMYVDIQKILAGSQASLKDTGEKAALDLSVKMWQDILVTGGEFKDGAYISYAEVTLIDKNMNSLKQLNNYIDQLSIIMKRKKNSTSGFDGVKDEPVIVAPPATSN